ncbi:ATP-binding protein [Paenibacillus sp. R14(2021)]|uniref:ATP-binding protein n=1 Tax=Paenibacillus sp. R14(2021) TaxID=2859228 RepID=UPI001C6150AB|nr:ATP-binding protein [Paenibacillus sp. R14(2021)]
MLAILSYEFHELLYILSACLLFFVVMPKAVFKAGLRKALYLAIFVLFSICYLVLESIETWVYALHLMPIGIMLAAVFEGWVTGMITWAAFVICGILIAHTDPAANIVSNSTLLAIGLHYHYNSYRTSGFRTITLKSLLFVIVHMALYTGVAYYNGSVLERERLLVITLGTILSAALIIYTHYKVKNQEKLQEELYSAEKYHMIGQLAASISHEIRNPLTTTRGFLQMMGKPNLDPDAIELYRMHAFEGVEHANAIITDLLNYAKPEVEEARPIDVQAEIESLLPWISPLSVMSSVEIKISHHQPHVFILGEPKKLQQCLLNLMKNAIEAMPAGGILSIGTKVEDNRLCIEIADTGMGMSSVQLKRIGLPFFTTKEKGTGLGLMVVVSLVRVMNGQITFNSKRGQGTVCIIQFPLIGTGS